MTKARLSRRAADFDTNDVQDFLHLRQPGALGEPVAFRNLRAWLDQHIDDHIGHERRGDEVEHDRGDHDVAAAFGLEIAWDQRPDAAEEGCCQDGEG